MTAYEQPDPAEQLRTKALTAIKNISYRAESQLITPECACVAIDAVYTVIAGIVSADTEAYLLEVQALLKQLQEEESANE